MRLEASFDPHGAERFEVASSILQHSVGTPADGAIGLQSSIPLGLSRRMKKILVFGFLAIGSEQLSAQALPSYDNSYWDSPECIKAVMNVTPDFDTEVKAKAVCNFSKSLDENAHKALVKIWDSIPSAVRSKCIADQVAYRKAHYSKVGTESYTVLSVCIDEQMK